jgi:hypothetical protein
MLGGARRKRDLPSIRLNGQEVSAMKLWISALVGMFALLIVSMPSPAASEAQAVQPQVISAQYLSPVAYYGHWHGGCGNPHFRRHHRFLCW